MEPIKKIQGKGMPLIIDDIDTDRIIPSRFLRCVTFDGIGEFAFYDERFDSDGNPTSFPSNDPKFKNAVIILSGKNFGCGSSREHAPQSIKRAGYKAVIAESFAEIFFGNSTTIGLACLSMDKKDIKELSNLISHEPSTEIDINLETSTVTAGEKTYVFTMPDVAQKALINGTYDLLSELLSNKDKIEKINNSLGY